ncbi:MAG: hypothetical protein FWF46_03400 [Oscillospiraceae bacterium]|nr:hypothetical protein [Oscillospiraceae bacterium]
MEKKEQVLDLFYNQRLKEWQIAGMVSVSQPYVHKIISKDKRHIKERLKRKAENLEKRKLYLIEYNKNYSRPKKEDIAYEAMKLQHLKDVMKLSSSSSNGFISNDSYRKWNSSSYTYNPKTQRLEILKRLKVSIDIPKHISTKRKLRPQKYKKRYYFSTY